jgi:hypothetical protein
MKTVSIKELMVPLNEYATVSEDATLADAIQALDHAQETFCQNKYRHRAILVLDNQPAADWEDQPNRRAAGTGAQIQRNTESRYQRHLSPFQPHVFEFNA